jgi:fructosamine-3-kinase
MPAMPVDVSWQVLRQIVHDWAGTSAELDEVKPLEGGSISTTLALHTQSGDRAVLKITPHRVDRSYADEAAQLRHLRQVGMPVPDVYACFSGSLDRPFSYLLLEMVDGQDLAATKGCCTPEEFDRIQSELAELMLRLHANTAAHYMRVSHEEPKRFDNWAHCYREIYDAIWHEVEKAPNLLPPKCRKTVARVHERLERLLDHDDAPRLAHGDVWSSNLLVRRDGDGNWRIAALLDPNCRYAHCECELAYMELFNTVTPAFLKAYQQSRRLPAEYHRVRRPVYQLYEMLNHVRLFGHEYLKSTIATIERVAPLV